MKRALVIGYGNPLRGDDGFGWHAAHRLAQLAHHAPIHVLAVHQLTPELAELVGNAELVIFIDASHEAEPGTWKCEEIATEAGRTNTLAHHFTPTILLGYARTVFHVSPPALIITLGAESFDYCETLTPRAEAALPEVLQYVLERIPKYSSAEELFGEFH
jgi:hydrogenase maturation protease